MKKLLLIGSTGSIGCQCLDVVRTHPGLFEIVALATNQNYKVLEEQCREFHPKYVALANTESAAQFPVDGLDAGTEFLSGPGSLTELARRCDADTAVIATVGAAGFHPTFEAIRSGKTSRWPTRKCWPWREIY